MNRVILKGRTGADVEFKYAGQKSTPMAKVSLGVPDKLEPKNRDKTYWAYLVIWGKLAEVFQAHVKKGQEILIEGRLGRATWEKDGVKHHKDEITVESMEFCGPPSQAAPASQGPDPDIPF